MESVVIQRAVRGSSSVRERRWIAVLVLALAAALARWIFCFLLFPAALAPYAAVGKQYAFDSYREIGASLVAGAGYRLGPSGPQALHRPPVYALFLAACDPADDTRWHVWLHFLHGLLGALAAVLTVRAAEAWGVGFRGALFAGWTVALWPYAIWETKVTVPENLLVVLVPASLLALSGARRSLAAAGAAGLLAAAMALTHATYQVAVLPMAAVVLHAPRSAVRRLAALAVFAAAFAFPTGAWIARNHRLGFDGIATGFGLGYFKGLYAYGQLLDGRPYFTDHDIPSGASVDRVLASRGWPPMDTNEARSDPALNRALDRMALEHLVAHPGFTAVKTAVRTPLVWVAERTPERSFVNAVLLLPLVVLAARGLRLDRSLWGLALFLLVLSAAFALVSAEAIPMRYALPELPALAILAGAGVGPRPS